MTTEDVRKAIEAERSDLTELLAGLTDAQWDGPTLCEGWRPREVVAHMTMPYRYTGEQFAAEIAKEGGNFGALSDRLAKSDAEALSAEELTACLRDNVSHPWQPPGGGFVGALSHDVIHGLDITVGLGLDRIVPAERLEIVLDGMEEKAVAFFGVDLSGIELRATDSEFTYGSGTPLTGRAQDLLLVVCGRTLPPGHLEGEPSGRFTRPEAGGFTR